MLTAGLPPVPIVMDSYYREALGDGYREVVEDRPVQLRERNDRSQGRGQQRRGWGQRGRNPACPAGGAPQAGSMAVDQVGRFPVIFSDAKMATGERICLIFNRRNCTR